MDPIFAYIAVSTYLSLTAVMVYRGRTYGEVGW